MTMTTRNVFITITLFTICLLNQYGHCEQLATVKKPASNRYLTHLFQKYGTQGVITFEGLEHLMYNLGLGGLEFSPKHTLDHHRPSGYKIPDIFADADDESSDSFSSTRNHEPHRRNNEDQNVPTDTNNIDDTTVADNDADHRTIAATSPSAYSAETDYNIIKLMNVFDNEKQEDIFRTMHDPNHRHPRHRDHSTSLLDKKCLSAISLIQMFGPDSVKHNPVYRSSSTLSEAATAHEHKRRSTHTDHNDDDDSHDEHSDLSVSNIQITPTTFLNICPALLVQIEQDSCVERDVKIETKSKPISQVAWVSAVISVSIISLSGLVGVAIVPLMKFGAYREILRFLVAIAIGTLCGDALMHLLPHALVGHDEESSESRHGAHAEHGISERDAVWLCGCAFMAALLMYAIESLLPLISGHGHGHSHANPSPNNNVKSKNEDMENDLEISKKNIEENVMVKDTKNVVRPALTPVAFMVVIGDGLHNLTDGMAIGAAFGVDPVTGMATALAVLCHELPHELGDFALLLQTGVSMRRAIFLNIVSSVLSFIGMVFGLFIVNVNSGFVRWIYAGTAGTFLYIALADLVPELGRTADNAKTVLIQIVGILLGGIIMLFIALYEDDLKSLFS